MRIVYIASFPTIHEYNILSKLAFTDHEIHLIDFFKRKYQDGLIKNSMYDNILNIPGLFVHSYNKSLESEKTGVLYAVLSVLRRTKFLKRKIIETDPDLIHSGWLQAGSLYAALSGFHPFLAMTFGSDVLINPAKSKWHFYVTRFVLRRADMINSDCINVKNEILRISHCNPDKITVFQQLGVDLKAFYKADAAEVNIIKSNLGFQGKKILLMTRNLEPIYAVNDFIESLPLIIKHQPRAHAVIVGDGRQLGMLKKMSEELGIMKNVTFSGFIENKNLPSYLKIADVYISSSLSDGTSLSLLEAMSCGLPAVVTDVPSNLEWIKDGHNGRVVPKGDSSSLGRAIIDLLNSPDKMKEMGAINIKIAREKICINKNLTRLLHTYEMLFKENK